MSLGDKSNMDTSLCILFCFLSLHRRRRHRRRNNSRYVKMPISTTDIIMSVGPDSPIPSPTLDQTTSRCAKYYQVVDGDDCSHLTAQFAITLKDLYTIHPRTHDWSFSFYANLEELTLPSSY